MNQSIGNLSSKLHYDINVHTMYSNLRGKFKIFELRENYFEVFE